MLWSALPNPDFAPKSLSRSLEFQADRTEIHHCRCVVACKNCLAGVSMHCWVGGGLDP
jgi:hypothetical protein